MNGELTDVLAQLGDPGSFDTDVFVFSGSIDIDSARVAINALEENKHRRSRILLLLETGGGDPHAAYKIARAFQRLYKTFAVFVMGRCKSAGTMIALGAHELIISNFGELGPLDIQTIKDDNLFFRSSGLDIQESIEQTGQEAYHLFQRFFAQIMQFGQGAITTKTAAEIASEMSIGLLAPITAQIDPLKVGEISRSMRIVQEYAIRLTRSCGHDHTSALAQLSSGYSSHSFVIDREEAASLLGDVDSQNGPVRAPNNIEQQLEVFLGINLRSKPLGAFYLNSKAIDADTLAEKQSQTSPEKDNVSTVSEIHSDGGPTSNGKPNEGGNGEDSPVVRTITHSKNGKGPRKRAASSKKKD